MNLIETITWIPVEERLPSDNHRVLIYEPPWVTGAYYKRYKAVPARWISPRRYVTTANVTHWAEQPKGPHE